MRTEEKNMHNNQQNAPSHLLDRFPGAPVTRKWLSRGQQWQQELQLQSPIQGLQSTSASSGSSSSYGNYKLSSDSLPKGKSYGLIILRDDESRTLPRASLIVVLFRYLASFQISSLPRPDHETHWPLFHEMLYETHHPTAEKEWEKKTGNNNPVNNMVHVSLPRGI